MPISEMEWTERFLHFVAPMAKERGIPLCIENLYSNAGGHLMEGPCCHVRKAVERIDRMNEKYGAEVLSFETAPVLSAFPKALKEDALSLIARIEGWFAEEIQS